MGTKSVYSSQKETTITSKRGSGFWLLSDGHRQRLNLIYRKWHLNNLAPVPFITVFMLVGGLFFWWSENGAEFQALVHKRKFYVGLRSEFIKGVELAMAEEQELSQTQRKKLLAFLVDGLFAQLGVHVPPEDEQLIVEQQEWTFTTAMYFSGTLFTTIGYGDIACETTMGQIGTIVYSFVGIPLMLITLNELGKFLYKMINEFMAIVNRKWHQYMAKYFSRCYKPPAPKKTYSVRSRYASFRDAKQAQKEMERKTTHFFKDQRIAQREIVFDYEFATEEGLSSTAIDLENPTVEESSRHQQRSGADLTSEQAKSTAMSILVEQDEVPRMHVLVAIFFTVSWVLFCAALFQHVEDWTYGKSLYFVCVSLLTVGLGDVKVARRGYMLLFFSFVMIGLSLVSMCINVIQNSIEDFYKRLLRKMIEDYKKGGAANAKHGWKYRLLLPFLGKYQREAMMREATEEARKQGVVNFPSNLEQIFEEPKEPTENSDEETTTRSDFSEVEVEIQPPSESEPEEAEEPVPDADMLLGIPAGWSRERRPSFQLDDHQMEQLPYVDDSVRLSAEEEKEGQEEKRKLTVPQLTVVPFTLIVTDEGEKRRVHSIEAPNSLLP